MKVYISTYHREINYGAALQAFAIQSYLKKLGYDSELIAFKQLETKSKVRNIKDLVNCFYNFFHRKEIAKGYENYAEFFSTYHKTTKNYDDYEHLLSEPPVDGIYLAGSDQIFNVISLQPYFFLQFGPPKVKRISYAASIGISQIPQEKEEKFREYLQSFDCLSIRECKSKDLIERYTDKEINVNLDPTYLVDRCIWERMKKDTVTKKIRGPYILVYAMYNPPWLNEALKRIHKQTRHQIVLLSTKGLRLLYRNICVMEAGPCEFLDLVYNASAIISSSFHGCVFATIFRKPFYAIANPAAPARIESLLEVFHLEDRMMNAPRDMDFNIDYEYMERKLVDEVEKARDYLISSITGEQG